MRNVHRPKVRKLPPKKKRVKVWCPGGGEQLEALTKKAHAHLEKIGSLSREEEDNVSKLQKRWKVRCSVCGRRLHPKKRIYFSEREFFGFELPKHKAA